jgi:4-diphosphocytidyl-2-C-methyl-D-erythritol kinase
MEPVLSDNGHWPAPAKLNLFLHITGRRDDGYHLLQTVFQFLDYGDELDIHAREDGLIRRLNELDGVAEKDDLVVRAARMLQQETGCQLGADIEVIKRLPIGGGLGGGSSDAATTLVALNALWKTGLDSKELARLGLKLGADVPIFIHGHAAWAEGVGEQFEPIEPEEPWYVVLRPAVSVPTGPVFGAPELTRDCPPITICDFLAGGGSNVFEPVVRDRYPEVGQVIDWLSEFSPARMTGSGSCVFASFPDRASAAKVFQQAPGEWQGFIARGRNRSPLLDRVAIENSARRN